MSKSFPNLAANLKRFRLEKKLTLRELATLTGVAHQNLHQIETGVTKQPSFVIIVSIANVFEITIEELIN